MNTEQNFNSDELVTFLWKKRKTLIIISVVAFIASVIGSLLMPNYYKAQAIVFPTQSNSVNFNNNSRSSVVEFGDESDAERLLQVLISPEIRDSLTLKYDLYAHFDIDSTESQAKFEFQKIYDQSVIFSRTRYNSITIDVFDKEPELATVMANDIVRLVDTVMNRMIRERSVGSMYAVQHEVALIREEMGDYSDKLKYLSDSGVVSLEARGDLYDNYFTAKKAGDTKTAIEIKKKIDASQKYGTDYDIYTNLTDFFSLRYSNILDVNDQAKQYASTNIQQTIRHSAAEVPDRKAKPKRSIIVLAATFSTLVFAIFIMLGLEKIKEIKAKA
jgi:capsular polysaccharide biosynthesis protein